MPIQIVAPTVQRFTVKHLVGGRAKCDVVIDLGVDEGLTGDREGAVRDVAAHFAAIWQDKVIGLTSNQVQFLGAHWIDLNSPDGLTGDIGPVSGHPSTGPSGIATASPQCCYLIHKNSTARRGQRQGRLYWTPVYEADVDAGGNIAAGGIDGQHTLWDGFRLAIDAYSSTALDSVAWRTVHVHKPTSDPASWEWSSSTIDTVACDPVVATQRRRVRP